MADHHHLVAALHVLIRGVGTAENWLDTEDREHVRRGEHPFHFIRRVPDDQAQSRRTDHPQMLERAGSLTPSNEVGLRDHVALDVSLGIGFPYRDDTIGVAIRQRLEQHTADHAQRRRGGANAEDRKSTRLNSSHLGISYAVFCLKKKKTA